MAFLVLVWSTVLFYAFACWHAYRSYRDLDDASDRKALRWLVAGFAAQGLALVLKGQADQCLPFASLDGMLLALAFSLTATLLLGRAKLAVPVLLSFFLPLILLLSVSALTTAGHPLFLMDRSLMTPGLASHIFLTFLGFCHFTLGFGVGMAFWVQEGQLKQHRVGGWSLRLPALEALDHLTVFYIGLGLLFWLGGLALGTVQAYQVWHRLPWSDPKIVGSFLVLLIYSFFFLLRWGLSMRGRRSMVLVMVGYLLALFTFVGVHVFMTTQHGF